MHFLLPEFERKEIEEDFMNQKLDIKFWVSKHKYYVNWLELVHILAVFLTWGAFKHLATWDTRHTPMTRLIMEVCYSVSFLISTIITGKH